MLLYADDLETMGIGKEGRKGLVLAYVVMAAMRAPFKWKKQRGGLQTEWIGLFTDYSRYAFGLSEKRADWLVRWMEGVMPGEGGRPPGIRGSFRPAGLRLFGLAVGEAVPWALVCLVLGYEGPSWEGHCPMGGACHP